MSIAAVEIIPRQERRAYVLAVVATAVVVAVRYSLVGLIGNEAPLLLFIVPVTLAAWCGGFKPGLVATFLAVASGVYCFMEHTGLRLHHPMDVIRVALLLTIGAAVSWSCEVFHRQLAEKRNLEASLRLSRDQLLQALEKIAIPTLLHADDGSVLVVNDAWTQITGYRQVDIPTIGAWTVRAFGSRHAAVKDYIDAIFDSDERRDHGEWEIMTAAGERRIWQVYTTPMESEPGGRRLLLTNAIDITSRRLTEDRLQESEQWYRVLTEISPQMVWACRPDGYVEYCNQHWSNYSGMNLEGTKGNGWIQAIRPDLREHVLCVWINAWQNASEYEVEIPFRRASDGMYRWHLAKGVPIKDESGQIAKWVGIAVDIHDHRHIQKLEEYRQRLEEANARLELLAATDGLTKLKNRRAFQDRLVQEVERAARDGSPLSLLLLDVDRFKQFNDVYGHPAGDRVLRSVACLLEETARSTDFVARYGGEEFAILLPNTDEDGAVAFVERFRRAVMEGDWRQSKITVSVGAATLTSGTDGAALVEEADAALYYSKRSGRNCGHHAARISGIEGAREEGLVGACTD